jgi:hypothetical protein
LYGYYIIQSLLDDKQDRTGFVLQGNIWKPVTHVHTVKPVLNVIFGTTKKFPDIKTGDLLKDGIFYDRTRKRCPFNTGNCLIEVIYENQYSNVIGYVTSNFIGQLHFQVRVNFTSQNIDLKWHTLHLLLKLLFKLNKILELIFSVRLHNRSFNIL